MSFFFGVHESEKEKRRRATSVSVRVEKKLINGFKPDLPPIRGKKAFGLIIKCQIFALTLDSLRMISDAVCARQGEILPANK